MKLPLLHRALAGIIISATLLAPVLHAQEASLFSRDQQEQIDYLTAQNTVSWQALGIENPGLLETNPFYFMKNWRRSTLRTFSFQPLKKAETELVIVSEKIAELKRLTEIVADYNDGLVSGIASYATSLDQLHNYLKEAQAKPADGLDVFLKSIVQRAFIHIWLLDALQMKADVRLATTITESQVIWFAILKESISVSSLESVFSELPGGMLKELLIAEVLERLEWNMSAGKLRWNIAALKQDALQRFGTNIEKEHIGFLLEAILELLPGNSAARIIALDEAREYIQDSNVKNDIASARQTLLDNAIENRNIGKLEASQLIEDTKKLYTDLLQWQSYPDIKSSEFTSLLGRASFNVAQAQQSFAFSQYGFSFGQASLAAAAAHRALHIVNVFGQSESKPFMSALQSLQMRYEQAVAQIQAKRITKEKSPDVYGALSIAEKSLAQFADAIHKKTLDAAKLFNRADSVEALIAELEYAVRKL
ncbi:MAG TPA: hypothetical protein VJH70_01995 [Candidatus Paceibacterota bacterium]